MTPNQLITSIKFYAPLFFAIAVSVLVGLLTHIIIYKILAKRLKNTNSVTATFFNHMRGPLYVIFPLFYLNFSSSLLEFTATSSAVSLMMKILFIVATSWSMLKLIDYSDLWLARKYQFINKQLVSTQRYNGLITKVYLLKKVAKIAVITLAIAFLLISFDSVRELGKGILVSASVLGAIIAFAAQKLFSNIISGFQLAFTQPIKIGDELSLEGEFGTIEEITLTHVTIRLWDLRRLILPLSYLIDKPFQNWTHPTAELLGTVYFYTDYNIPVNKLRAALTAALEATTLWDKKISNLQVTDMSEKAMQLRVLLSARNAGELWDLRCHIREELIAFIHKEFPKNLPKIYAKFENEK